MIFPNTVPPFFPSCALFARAADAEDYSCAWPGSARTTAGSPTGAAEFPERRAGIGQIFLNDVDDAIAEVEWMKDHGLRGGVLIPRSRPTPSTCRRYYSDQYDPLWAVCEERGVVGQHATGTGLPDYGKYPAPRRSMDHRDPVVHAPTLVQLLMSGVFERFPKLKLVLTEQGCDWIPPRCMQLDGFHMQMRRRAHRRDELQQRATCSRCCRASTSSATAGSASSFPCPTDDGVRDSSASTSVMWGCDYPHNEGTSPFTRESLRRTFLDGRPKRPAQGARRQRGRRSTASTSRSSTRSAANVGPNRGRGRHAARSDPGRLGEPGVHPLTHGSRSRMARDATDTRERLLMTAQTLFAHDGIYQVPLKRIVEWAGQRNTVLAASAAELGVDFLPPAQTAGPVGAVVELVGALARGATLRLGGSWVPWRLAAVLTGGRLLCSGWSGTRCGTGDERQHEFTLGGRAVTGWGVLIGP